MKQLITLLALVILLASCQKKKEQWIQHEKGFQYIVHQHKENAKKPKVGDVLVLNLSYYTENDSLIFSSKELNTPFRMKLKKAEPNGETIDDALAMMAIGDSMSFKVNANLFYTLTRKQKAPKWLKIDDDFIFHIRLKSIFDYDKYLKNKKKKQTNTAKSEKEALKKYLEIANIKTDSTKTGLYYIEEKKGNGLQASIGDSVWVNYIGTFLSGEPFSNSYKTGRPFAFVLGKDDIIQGFAEGISLMHENESAMLIIPSKLAYGANGNQVIPPYSTLIFNIELLKVKKN